MFEDKTREKLKADMMAELDPSCGLSKLEGGFLDQIFGPPAVEMEKIYAAMDGVFHILAVDETCGGLIDVAAGNYSMERKGGVAATAVIHFVGAVGTYIPPGAVFATASGLCYALKDGVTLAGTGKGVGLLVAQEVGVRYKVPAGAIDRPYDNPVGLESFSVEDAVGGVDPESDAALVGRYYDKLQRPVTSGNHNHYRQWAMEVPGVGEAKVISLVDGPGTVGVTLVSESFGPVDTTVVDNVVATLRPSDRRVRLLPPTSRAQWLCPSTWPLCPSWTPRSRQRRSRRRSRSGWRRICARWWRPSTPRPTIPPRTTIATPSPTTGWPPY